MNPIARTLWNPIVAKEYRSRMRTWRSPLTITIHVIVLGGIGWAVFSAIANSVAGFGSSGGGVSPSSMGILLFTFLILFQIVLLAFITPALTSGAISGERERQTIDLLFVTPLAPFSIIWGKLLASMSFVVLLLVLSVPIFSLVFLFGGIELDQVVYAFAVTGATALMLPSPMALALNGPGPTGSSRITVVSGGMSWIVGSFTSPRLKVEMRPSSVLISSISAKPSPWMSPPSICPWWPSGLMTVPTSCAVVKRRTVTCPVCASTATSAT